LSSKRPSESNRTGALPFGAGAIDTELAERASGSSTGGGDTPHAEERAPRSGARDTRSDRPGEEGPVDPSAVPGDRGPGDRSRGERPRRGRRGRGGRRPGTGDAAGDGAGSDSRGEPGTNAGPAVPLEAEQGADPRAEGEGDGEGRSSRRRRWQDRRSRRRRRRGGRGEGEDRPAGDGADGADGRPASRPPAATQAPPRDRGDRPPGAVDEIEGILLVEKASHGTLRREQNGYFAKRDDPHVPSRLVQKYSLRDGCVLRARGRRQGGRFEVQEILQVDGQDPWEARSFPRFKQLTSIDPDFHYAVGDGSGEVALKVLDVLCPVGRGQRGLIVAPPRSGKTILLQQFAKAIETIYPEVHLMVLLVDERPEEATEWQRSTGGQVFVSTNDEMATRHVEVAEVVWKRSQRLVEMGQDVVLLLDSITRLGRAYNNVHGNSGKTMSGGIDTRALERPKQFFGSARNTETAGSLTILGTTLIETGSRMDQVIFEEFKGTGNMELVLSRKLADRRVFPAIDIQKSGTRKEEKLVSSQRLKRMHTLRRVLLRMHFAEAMELLITKLDDVERIDDFLQRFEVDPDA